MKLLAAICFIACMATLAMCNTGNPQGLNLLVNHQVFPLVQEKYGATIREALREIKDNRRHETKGFVSVYAEQATAKVQLKDDEPIQIEFMETNDNIRTIIKGQKVTASVKVGVHFKVSLKPFGSIDKRLGFTASITVPTPTIKVDMGLTKQRKPMLIIHDLDMGIHPERAVAKIFNWKCPKLFPGCDKAKRELEKLIVGKCLGGLVNLMEGAVEREVIKQYKNQVFNKIPDSVEAYTLPDGTKVMVDPLFNELGMHIDKTGTMMLPIQGRLWY